MKFYIYLLLYAYHNGNTVIPYIIYKKFMILFVVSLSYQYELRLRYYIILFNLIYIKIKASPTGELRSPLNIFLLHTQIGGSSRLAQPASSSTRLKRLFFQIRATDCATKKWSRNDAQTEKKSLSYSKPTKPCDKKTLKNVMIIFNSKFNFIMWQLTYQRLEKYSIL